MCDSIIRTEMASAKEIFNDLLDKVRRNYPAEDIEALLDELRSEVDRKKFRSYCSTLIELSEFMGDREDIVSVLKK